jgi:MFS transporter, PPP family, 3-phenylpropionic acid transporter
MSDSLRSVTLLRFLLLYAAMYAAFGVASPFLPAFVSARGVRPEQLGLLLGAGTAVRLLTAPLAGRLGDALQALRAVLVACTGLAAAVTPGYLAVRGWWGVLGVSLLQAASLAPITVLADALALGAASPPPGSGRRGFEYGWVRGTGSAAFIVGTVLSGQVVSAFGLDSIVCLQAVLLAAAVCDPISRKGVWASLLFIPAVITALLLWVRGNELCNLRKQAWCLLRPGVRTRDKASAAQEAQRYD